MLNKLKKIEEVFSQKIDLKRSSKLVGKTMILMLFFATIMGLGVIFPSVFLITIFCLSAFFFLWFSSQKIFNISLGFFVIIGIVFYFLLNLEFFFFASFIALVMSTFIALHFSKKYNKFACMIISGFFLSVGVICLSIKFFNINTILREPYKGVISDFLGLDPSIFYIFLAFSNMFTMVFSTLYLFCKVKHKKNVMFPFRKLGFKKTFNIVFIGLLGCFIAQIISLLLIQLVDFLGIKLKNPNLPISWHPLSLFLYFFSTSVVPALAEEFAFRGVILGFLRKYGENFAIIVQAFIFGFIHANIFQVPFAFMVGLILGFILIKTNSMLPGMMIHFLNNFLSCILSVFSKISDEIATQIFFLAWGIIILLGFMSFIIMKRRDRDFFKIKSASILKTRTSSKIFFSNPLVILFNIFTFLLIIITFGVSRF